MSNAIVSNVYRYVIDDVINQVRGEFEDMGIDDAVLQELQRSWETKVARSRVANFGFSNEGYYEDEGDQNNGNSTTGTDKNVTSHIDTNNTSSTNAYSEAYSQQHGATVAANLATLANSSVHGRPDTAAPMRPQLPPTLPHLSHPSTSSYPLPSAHLPSLSSINNNINNGGHYPPMNLQRQPPPHLPDIQLPGGGRPNNNLPQNDGADDAMTTEEIDAHLDKRIMATYNDATFSATTFSGKPLDIDTLPDHIKLLINDVRAKRIGQLDGGDDDDDINSDLDDPEDDDDDPDGGEEVENIILCLYDKVTRTKNKWKCVLRDGIMLVNGRDYLFSRANGDFEW
ncbi:hypothetical protein [Absidia glauca]|uniref:Transcription initiation factor IIA large subunit n=1 Tax=Absidia glauca TaxID=4829 RepID=A0A168LPR5_ABSGL|nr:hypothetical protein [Absidia glauca]